MSTLKTFLSDLNDAQLAPVLQIDGPLIVIAGAGSGKTRVLIYRIANLMKNGIDSFSILALTFTNKAAKEMKSRISNLVGEAEAKNLWMGTFHSVFARILREEAEKLGYPKDFTIYDTQDSARLISAIIKEMGLDKDIYKYKQIRNRISSFKNSLITVKAYFNDPDLQEADSIARRPKIGEIYKEYVSRCFKAGAMDFDDLLLKTNELINIYPQVLAKYQNRFKYILVDEYQDTNHSQYLIIRALSDKFQNICVVGDDAQSIYGFRGANINNILNFQKDYHGVMHYRLEQNYRSTKNIVNAANSIISHNKNKIDKVVWTSNNEGPKIKILRCMTDADEGREVASSIFDNKMYQHRKNNEFAVLYRTNAQSRSIEDALRKRDIPYRVFGGLSFYQRKEIKDIIAYLRLIVNPNDEESLRRIINYPTRGIGQATLDKLTIGAKNFEISLFETIKNSSELKLSLNSGTKKKLSDFSNFILSLQIENLKSNAFEIAEKVFNKSGLLLELKKDGTPEGVSKIENVEELLNGIRDFVDGQKEIVNANDSLSEFLMDIALATDFDKENNEIEDCVYLMTVHLSKGLEFPIIYVVGLEEDLFPSALSFNTREDLEEERRLFYVALTRAKEKATITYTLSRYRWGKLIDSEPSRFIEEMDEKFLEYEICNEDYIYKPSLDKKIFNNYESDQNKFFSKIGHKKTNTIPSKNQLGKLKKINSDKKNSLGAIYNLDTNLKPGARVEHARFGYGNVMEINGKGDDKKALISFDNSGNKNLLLRFAKLKIKK